MSAMDYGNLAYLVLLGAVVVFWFVVQNRQSLNKTLQQGAVWGLIFLGVIAADLPPQNRAIQKESLFS